MTRIRLRALGPLSYQGRTYAAGDAFDASRVAAYVFRKRGRAEMASESAPSEPVALGPASESEDPPAPRRRRRLPTTYETRDLRAED